MRGLVLKRLKFTSYILTLQAIRYADALGRPTQAIGIAASPLGHDVAIRQRE